MHAPGSGLKRLLYWHGAIGIVIAKHIAANFENVKTNSSVRVMAPITDVIASMLGFF